MIFLAEGNMIYILIWLLGFPISFSIGEWIDRKDRTPEERLQIWAIQKDNSKAFIELWLMGAISIGVAYCLFFN